MVAFYCLKGTEKCAIRTSEQHGVHLNVKHQVTTGATRTALWPAQIQQFHALKAT